MVSKLSNNHCGHPTKLFIRSYYPVVLLLKQNLKNPKVFGDFRWLINRIVDLYVEIMLSVDGW